MDLTGGLIPHARIRFYVRTNRLQGKESHWFGYLQSLPQETVDLALFWGVGNEILDGRADWSEGHNYSAGTLRFRDSKEALTWITGTELEKEMRGSAETGETLLVSYCMNFRSLIS
jgi:hypothetical protein